MWGRRAAVGRKVLLRQCQPITTPPAHHAIIPSLSSFPKHPQIVTFLCCHIQNQAFQPSAHTSASSSIELRWLNESQTRPSTLVLLRQVVSAITYTPQVVAQRLQRSNLRVCSTCGIYSCSLANKFQVIFPRLQPRSSLRSQAAPRRHRRTPRSGHLKLAQRLTLL